MATPRQLTLNIDTSPQAAGAGPSTAWIHQCRAAVELAVRAGLTFQAADLVTHYGLPEPTHPNQWGAAFSTFAHEGLIAKAFASPSRRTTVAGSLVWNWSGTHSAQAA